MSRHCVQSASYVACYGESYVLDLPYMDCHLDLGLKISLADICSIWGDGRRAGRGGRGRGQWREKKGGKEGDGRENIGRYISVRL